MSAKSSLTGFEGGFEAAGLPESAGSGGAATRTQQPNTASTVARIGMALRKRRSGAVCGHQGLNSASAETFRQRVLAPHRDVDWLSHVDPEHRGTKNICTAQLLLGHTKLESTVRDLDIEVDALEIADKPKFDLLAAL